MAERDRVDGRPSEALERLEPLPARALGLEGHAVCVAPHVALCHVALGNVARAEEIMSDILPRARALDMRFFMPEVLAVHGLVQVRLGNRDVAEAACREAVDTARSMPCPWLEARSLLTHSYALHALGNHEMSGDFLRQAGALFNSLGAQMYFDRVTSSVERPPLLG